MKHYRVYFSPRCKPLLYMGNPCEVPVVTLENYTKWYEIFLVMPDGSVQAVDSGIVTDIEDPKVRRMWVDHHYHPRLLYRLAEYYKGTVDERAVEVAAGRWMIERVDDDKNQFHDPSLDE